MRTRHVSVMDQCPWGTRQKGACDALEQEFDTVQDFGVFGHHDNFERALASDSLV